MGPTEICNMALGRIGANRINDYTDTSEDSVEAIQCRLHYTQTRNSLLRSHFWRFARERATLSANTTDPDFEWDYAYDLPNDFIRLIRVYEDNSDGVNVTRYTYRMEGKQILSDEDSMEIRYIKRVTDPNEFDPLFTEILILQLALKLIIPLAGGGREGQILRREIHDELIPLIRQARAIDKLEMDSLGDNDRPDWNASRVAGLGNPLKRYS